jgi:hypothetical protein
MENSEDARLKLSSLEYPVNIESLSVRELCVEVPGASESLEDKYADGIWELLDASFRRAFVSKFLIMCCSSEFAFRPDGGNGDGSGEVVPDEVKLSIAEYDALELLFVTLSSGLGSSPQSSSQIGFKCPLPAESPEDFGGGGI